MEVNMNRYLSDKEWLGHITSPTNKDKEKQLPTKPQAAPPKAPFKRQKQEG